MGNKQGNKVRKINISLIIFTLYGIMQSLFIKNWIIYKIILNYRK